MRRSVGSRGFAGLLLGCAAALVSGGRAAAEDPYAEAPSYLRALSARVTIQPLLTVGQTLPLTGGDEGQTFRFVGRPDGLGIYPLLDPAAEGDEKAKPKKGQTRFVLIVAHELGEDEGGPAGPLPRGARLSEILLDWSRARYLPRPFSVPRLFAASGRPAIERVFTGDDPELVEPVTRGFAKFCSGFLADDRVGFDRPVFLTGEESDGPHTFDPRGGQVWAVVEGSAFALPRFGRAAWENVVVAPFTDTRTVAFGLEDASAPGQDSQLYLYLGEKQPEADDVLARNGLRGGRVHVLCPDDSARGSEAAFRTRGDSLAVHWAELEWDLSDSDFEAAARAAGAFQFIRIEDGALDPKMPGRLYFATTGKAGSANPRGRLYRLRFDPESPLAGAWLDILLDGTEGVVHPDNVGVNGDGQIAIQEDPGEGLRDLGLPRDSSIWIYDVRDGELARIATMDREAARIHALAADPANEIVAQEDYPGSWESSGIVDASALLGRGTWICSVQAPSLRVAPAGQLVAGGQILRITYR